MQITVSQQSPVGSASLQTSRVGYRQLSINLLVVYRESVNLIGYITRRLSADSQQL